MDYLVGVDLGSTSLKAIVYEPSGRAVARASRPTERRYPDAEHSDWAVWQPEEIWGGVCQSLREVVGQLDRPGSIRGVAVTGMGMDGVPIAPDGSWLYPFISWHCPRTLPQQRWWQEAIGPEKQFSTSGSQLWHIYAGMRLRWMREHRPRVLDRAEKWLLIEDFVNFMLSGEKATDYSMASCTLLFDQRTRTWSDELLAATGVDRRLLPELLPAGTPLGRVHARAPEGTPVVLGGHDYCCGALPTGVFRPGVVLDVTGTWEMVVAALEQPVLTREVLGMGAVVDSHVARGMWSVMGGAVAADMLEWFRREFGFEEREKAAAEGGVDWDHLMRAAAASPPGARGVRFLPHMSGCSCPVVDSTSMGAFVGLRNVVTKGDLLRAVVEALDFQFLQIVRGYESALGVRPERIVAIGGAINNPFWMQNKADVVGRPIEVPDLDEAVVLGAAILAGIGVGLYRDEDDAFRQVHRPGRVYEPNPALAEQYARWYETYELLYPALKDIHARLY